MVGLGEHLSYRAGIMHVYFIRCGDHLKIGYAKNPKQRLADLQVGSPLDLTLLGAVKCDDAPGVEFALHRAFAQYRVRGEWFECVPAVEATVDAILNGRSSLIDAITHSEESARDTVEALGRKRARQEAARRDRASILAMSDPAIRRALADSAQDKVDAHLRLQEQARNG